MPRDQDDQRDDHAAIRAVLANDFASYLARDKARWEACWVQDNRFQSIMECGALQIARGYAAFRDNIFAAMDAEPDQVDADVRIENLQIDRSGDIAWATYEEIVTESSNPHVAPSHSHNFRLLERAGGQWKILVHGCWAEPLRDTAAPAIEVSAEGRVLWLNDAARARLAVSKGLTISNGVLRTSTPSRNEGLRNAISGAHDLTGFGEFNRAADGGGDVRVPVVLGEDDDGALLWCWVEVSDGRVYVLFEDGHDLSRQVDIARAIYRLSDTQCALLRHLTSGSDVSDAAEALGVTKNTVRTHLRRIFEKTGTGSQIELIRLLIGFGT